MIACFQLDLILNWDHTSVQQQPSQMKFEVMQLMPNPDLDKQGSQEIQEEWEIL